LEIESEFEFEFEFVELHNLTVRSLLAERNELELKTCTEFTDFVWPNKTTGGTLLLFLEFNFVTTTFWSSPPVTIA
jgi:hypothetical protein